MDKKKAKVAAIFSAISTYLEEEEKQRGAPAVIPLVEERASPWRVFGRQELMRARRFSQSRRPRS